MSTRMRRPALLGLSLLLVLAAIARAGTYDVRSCDPGFDNGATAGWNGFESPGFTAYGNCTGGNPEGLVARTNADGGTASGFQNAYAEFDAPPGTTIASIHGYFQMHRPGCNWAAGLRASNGSLGDGWWVFALQPGYCGTNTWGWSYWDWPINATHVMEAVACGAASCDRSIETRAAARGLRITINDPTPPTISGMRGALWSTSGWVRGTQDIAFDANDGSGIKGTYVIVDGLTVRLADYGCDYALPAPCPNKGFAGTFDTHEVGDGQHTLTLRAVDTAGNQAEASQTIHVDNTPPAAPISLSVDGGEGWRATDHFAVSWTNPPDGGGALIAGASYQLCHAASGDECTSGSANRDTLTHLDGLQVPSPGDWTLKLWLRDAAGNESADNAGPLVHLRFDDQPPELSFEPANPADPTLVSVLASDALSGIAQGRIEIRHRGSSRWQTLPSNYAGTHITARLDDEHMRSGDYGLRAWAIDAAGNERSASDRIDGSSADVRLPVRVPTRILAGSAGHHHGHQGRRSSVVVAFGHPARLGGRLLARDGNPIADSQVTVYARQALPGAAWSPVASLHTSPHGWFNYKAPKGTSRTIRFRFDGTPTVRPSLRDVALDVRAASTVWADRTRLANGEYVHLSGRLLGAPIPAGGKLVEVQALLRGSWHTFATTHTHDRGRWRYEYRFTGTRGNPRYRMRLRIPHDDSYPYSVGHSRTITLHIRGW